jgi:hypothetical protein
MGMVHEKPIVVTRRSIDESDVMTGAQAMEPASVLEVREANGDRQT